MPIKSPADQLADYLVTQGVATNTDGQPWFITVGGQLPAPDQQITMYDLSGQPGLPTLLIDYPSIQVRVRGKKNDYRGAYSKMYDIRALLNGIEPLDLNGDHWDGLIIGTDVLSLGNDQNSRPEMVITFKAFLERSASVSTFERRTSL